MIELVLAAALGIVIGFGFGVRFEARDRAAREAREARDRDDC